MKWREYTSKVLSTIDNERFYLDELQKDGQVVARSGTELKCSCPFAELHASGRDSKPSFTVNLQKGTYFCNSCGSKGNIMTYYAATRGLSRVDAWTQLGDALGIERPETMDSRLGIDPALPAVWHRKLMSLDAPIRRVLAERRGLSDETLRRFLIGWDGERVTIPIYSETLELLNIRRYSWNSSEDAFKMLPYQDVLQNSYGENTIYGIEHLFDDSIDTIVWCEGEWDRLIAEQWGLPACSGTAGANNFMVGWYALLKRKKIVYLAYDNDAAGERATQDNISQLYKSIEVHRLVWPDGTPEHYDVTDLAVKQAYTKEKFLALFDKIDIDNALQTVPLGQSALAKYTGKRICVPALVAGKITTPYVLPSCLSATCEYYDEEKKGCSGCIFAYKPRVEKILDSRTTDMLTLIECSQERQELIVKRLLGIPQKCPCAKIEQANYKNLELLQLVPKADTSYGFGGSKEYCTRYAYTLDNNIFANKRYTFIGYMHPDPNNQRATHIFDSSIPEKNMVEEFEMSDEIYAQLKVFQPSAEQTVAEKMREIHTDLERNVTYVWERRSVAYATDLVYHSVIGFSFQEQAVKRGWAECLILGDSGQAKTTLVERLMQHYQLGELLNGESTKRTGLVYNIKQAGDAWLLNWGAMPLNDGGLLTIDELSGMSADDLAKMSDVRSSGIAKATGVVTGETLARTRMIFISNPRSGRQLKAEQFGVNAVLKLIGAAEDVRRLDFAVGVASGEVDTKLINSAVSEFAVVPHVYTAELCRLRVLWAWSRRPEHVQFTPGAVTAILEHASAMGAKYSSRIPLVESADQRIKLARLSTAAACCTFSTDDGDNVIVTKEHADFVFEYLNSVYDARALEYNKFSAADFENSNTSDIAMQRLRTAFLEIPIASRTVHEVAISLCQLNQRCNRNSIADATGLDGDDLRSLLPFLINNSILDAAGDGAYYKTTAGRQFLEGLVLEPPTAEEIAAARKRRHAKSEL